MTIWKFELEVSDTQLITMPLGARFLCVQVQRDVPCLWALVEPSAPDEDRRIQMRGTGHWLRGVEGKYIGTFQLDGGHLVYHVFEGK